jgi:hypothetical protein
MYCYFTLISLNLYLLVISTPTAISTHAKTIRGRRATTDDILGSLDRKLGLNKKHRPNDFTDQITNKRVEHELHMSYWARRDEIAVLKFNKGL